MASAYACMSSAPAPSRLVEVKESLIDFGRALQQLTAARAAYLATRANGPE